MSVSEAVVINILGDDSFVLVNKKLSVRLGFVEAGLLGEMISWYKYCKKEKKFFKGGEKGPWFYLTQPYVEANIGIRRDGFDSAVKKLVAEKIVIKKRMGLPAKNYYQLNWDKIVEFLADEPVETAPLSDCGNSADLGVETPQTSPGDSGALDVGKSTPIKSTLQKQNKKTIYKTDDDDMGSASFEINGYAFNEFVLEISLEYPDLFDENMFSRIYKEMDKRKLDLLTVDEAVRQVKRMKSYGLEKINSFAPYFVQGILENRLSKQSALAERKYKKAVEELRKKEEKRKAVAAPLPFYNWLEN